MFKVLSVNIRQFEEEEPEVEETETEDFSKYIGEHGDLDVSSLVNDYKSKETTEEEEEEHEAHAQNPNEEESTEEEHTETSEEEEETEETEETNTESSEEETQEKRTPDQAFADLRRKAEQNEKYAKWANDLAKDQGFEDAEQLMEAVNRKKLEAEAEEKGVPVEMYERLQKLEESDRQKDDQLFAERFNREVEEVKEKNNLNDSDLQKVFQYMGERGFIDENGRTNIPFEEAYFLANKDTIIKQTEEKARQQYLEEKEKLQQGAAHNTKQQPSDSLSNEKTDYSKDEVFSYLEKHGIPID